MGGSNTTIDSLDIEIGASSKDAVDGINKVVNALKTLKNELAGVKGKNAKVDFESDGVERATQRANSLHDTLKRLHGDIGNVARAFKDMFPSSDKDSVAYKIESAFGSVGKKIAPVMVAVGHAGEDAFQAIGNAAHFAGGKIKDGISHLREWNKELKDNRAADMKKSVEITADTSDLKEAKKEVDKTTDSVKKLNKEADKSGGIFKKIATSVGRIAFYRLIRSGIRMITDGFKEGLENAYKFDKLINGNLSNSLDNLSTAGFKMKNQLGAAFGELLIAITPTLLKIADVLTVVADKISQLLAALSGQTTYLKAIDYWHEWGDAADDAGASAKKALRYLAPFDELNVLPSAKSGGSGSGNGGMDYDKMFEVAEIESLWAKLGGFFANLAINIKDVFFKWDGLDDNDVRNKLFALLGGALGFAIGGPVGAIVGTIGGVALSMIIDSDIDFDVEKVAKVGEKIVDTIIDGAALFAAKSVDLVYRKVFVPLWNGLINKLSEHKWFNDLIGVFGLSADSLTIDVPVNPTFPEDASFYKNGIEKARTRYQTEANRNEPILFETNVTASGKGGKTANSKVKAVTNVFSGLIKATNPTLLMFDTALKTSKKAVDFAIGGYKAIFGEEDPLAIDTTAHIKAARVDVPKKDRKLDVTAVIVSTTAGALSAKDKRLNMTANFVNTRGVDIPKERRRVTAIANFKDRINSLTQKETTFESYADIVKFKVSAEKPTVNITGKIDEIVYDEDGKFRPITKEAGGGVFANGRWGSITAYAGGGNPMGGQLFLAREAGPELVGTLGGHTAVMNNDQIVASVSNGVMNANEIVVGAVMTAAAQVVAAINANGGRQSESNVDSIARAVTTWQRRNAFASGV